MTERVMGPLIEIGKGLLVVGLAMVILGTICLAASRVPWLGRLPGDVLVHRGSWTFYAPLGTCLVVSVLLSLIFWFLGRR